MKRFIREFIPEKSADDKDKLLPAFLDIWNHADNLKFLSFTMKPFDQTIVRFWLENHKEQGGHYFCYADQNDDIAGIAVVKINPIEGFELFGLGVRPEFKSQGIGSKLIEYTINQARTLDFKAVDVSVFADNIRMLRLLLSLDFVPVSMDFHKRSDGTDVVHMKRYFK
ncbi:MAG: GNAT family N-acetyltransferase [Desulfobacterales bacterium]|nr:GNAT family N-acetyltransferase [Desulfobacterales bacterium]